MSLSESVRQLEEQVRRSIEAAMEGVRNQLQERLREHHQNLQEQVRSLDVDLPENLLDSDRWQGWVDEAVANHQADTPAVDGSAPLHPATRAIDQAGSQSQVLQALLSHTDSFADRAAVFLAQPGKLQGWGGRGFDAADTGLRQVGLATTPGTGWSRLLEGEGVVRLESSDRVGLASHLEVPVAREAVLIPLVLRNRVAGAVYADRTTEDADLALEGLQVLTYIAALALETLPLRDRPATATLHLAAETEAPEVTEPEPTAPETTEPETTEPATTGDATPTMAAPSPPPVPVTTETSPPVPVEATPAAVTPTPEPTPAPEPEPEAEDEDSPALADVEVEDSGELEVTDLEVEETELEEPEEVELEVERDMGGDVGGDLETGLVAEETVSELSGEAEVTSDDISTEHEVSVDDVGVAEPPAAEQEPETARDAETATDARQAGFQMEEEPAEPEAAPESPSEPPAAPAAAPAPAVQEEEDTRPGTEGAAQVAPPSDVQGPGWAFGGGGEERDGDEEALHEEARRLARLLVSEIKLYNEDQVLEGRRSQDIFDRLKEDIEKSRQLYESRVDDRVRDSTDYFYQEMVRVLGAGDPKTLGI